MDGEVFTFIEQLERLASAREVAAALERVLATFNIPYFMFLHAWPNGSDFDRLVFCKRLPEGWYNIYLQEGYSEVDPAFSPRRRSSRPFLWPECSIDREEQPRTAAFIRRAAEFGLALGLVVPIFRGPLTQGVVWFGGADGELTSRTIAALHLVALYAFERILFFHAPPRQRKPALTRRERETLRLAADGNKARDIAKLLGINKRTVEEHLQAAMRKLGAVNRTQAVVIALCEGDIDICS
jgi:LuxR family transcriptional regulator, quorum-sensing system regulator BjaR1